MAQEYGPPVLSNGIAPSSAPYQQYAPHYNSLPALIPPIQASGPPPEYNSSDAESLDEVPIESATYRQQGVADGYPFHGATNVNLMASYPPVPHYYRYPPRPMAMLLLRPLHEKKAMSAKKDVVKDVNCVIANNVSLVKGSSFQANVETEPNESNQSDGGIKEESKDSETNKANVDALNSLGSSTKQLQPSNAERIVDNEADDNHKNSEKHKPNDAADVTSGNPDDDEEQHRMARRRLAMIYR